jgi:hypothetical protein
MASTTSKEPETPGASGFEFDSKATPSLLKSIPSASNERPPSLSPQLHSDWTPEEDQLVMQIGNPAWPISRIDPAFGYTKTRDDIRQRYKVLLQREATWIEENLPRGRRMHETPKAGEAEEKSQLARVLEGYRQKKVRLQELTEMKEADRRLQVSREAEGWDTQKFQRLARDYMVLREQMWRGLAAHVGESWDVVEAKVNTYPPSPCSRISIRSEGS